MTLVELSIRRRVTIAMFTVTLVLFGLIALKDLKVNLLPDLTYPTLTVRTEYPGAAPAEVETLISQPVEEGVGVVKNVRKIRSISRTGQSDVVLEFAWGTDMERASLEVRDKLEVLQLPLQAKQPVLLRFNPSTDPIIRLGLASASSGKNFNEAELKLLRRFADEELKKRLDPVDGVAAVKIGGGLEDEIQVSIDQRRLAMLNLPISEVTARLSAENVNVSAGRIEEGSQRYLVRTVNQFASVAEIANMVVRVDPDSGSPVRLRDVAEVGQGYREREAIIRIDGNEAVELAIYKEGDANTVTVADAVHEALEQLKPLVPESIKLSVVDDQSIFIRNALKEVRNAALEGGLLAILVIFFFLKDGWSTFVVGLSLPVSLIATFFFMGQAGLSLNVMSLGGLALATGMVVDDSIVVLENIARMRERGFGILESARRGTMEVGLAVTASTLTTCAVFFPLVFVEGVAGQLFRDQALTVTIAMLISLLIAMTLIPMLASLKSKAPAAFHEEEIPEKPPARTRVGSIWRRSSGFIFGAVPSAIVGVIWQLVAFIGRGVGRALTWLGDILLKPYDWAAAAYAKHLPGLLQRPVLVLGGSAVAFAISVGLLSTLGMDLIPQLQQGRFDMTVTLPPGTPLAQTDALVRDIQRRNQGNSTIKGLFGVSGTGTRLDANPTESGENIGRLLVTMVPGSDDEDEAAAMEKLREGVAGRPGLQQKFSRPQLFSFATPLEVEIRGLDLDRLSAAGNEMAKRLSGSDRFTDVKSTVEQGYPEVQIRFDQDRAAALGLTTRQIADQVVSKVRGEVATRYSFLDRKIDVLVRAVERDRSSLDDIRNLVVNPESARPVTLSAVADVISTEGPSEIHRLDQERVALVSANLAYGDLGTAVAEVESMLAESPLGAGVDVRIGGQSEELDASVDSLIFALSLAIFLVYLVMASQFESLLHPFVILFTIPLALVGAVLALKLTGTPLSIVVFIGFILLVGIVVKNAIVLIDRVNQLRGTGMTKREAIVAGANARLRPIAMTTLCTLFGFLPLALSGGDGAEVRAPMAICVIGGLLVSTLLTLVVIPVMYDLLDRKPDSAYREYARRAGETVDGEDEDAALRSAGSTAPSHG